MFQSPFQFVWSINDSKLTIGVLFFIFRTRKPCMDFKRRFSVVGEYDILYTVLMMNNIFEKKYFRHEGLLGFYKGLKPNLVRVIPATMITFLTYENVSHFMLRREQKIKLPSWETLLAMLPRVCFSFKGIFLYIKELLQCSM